MNGPNGVFAEHKGSDAVATCWSEISSADTSKLRGARKHKALSGASCLDSMAAEHGLRRPADQTAAFDSASQRQQRIPAKCSYFGLPGYASAPVLPIGYTARPQYLYVYFP
jgi:hypothetical protein